MKILITGGSRGIGRAIAQECALAGHDLLLVARDSLRLEKTALEIGTACSVSVKSFACDAAQLAQLESLRAFCQLNQCMPDVLVLNAGIFIEGSLTTASQEDFDETLRVDFFAAYHAVRIFHDHLKTAKLPKIILIGSTAAYEAYTVGPLYGVAKWALRGFAVNLRKELVKDNISVSLVSPGGTLTDLWEGEELPPARLLDPSDIGKLVVALLSLSPQAVVEEIIVKPMLGDMHD